MYSDAVKLGTHVSDIRSAGALVDRFLLAVMPVWQDPRCSRGTAVKLLRSAHHRKTKDIVESQISMKLASAV